MNTYLASITYAKDTIIKLEDAIYHAFGLRSMLIRGAMGIAVILAGMYIKGTPGIAMIFLGAVIATAGNVARRLRGENTADKLKGKSVKVQYTFTDKDIRIQSVREEGTVRYRDLIRLYEEGGYYYLFPNRNSGYMIDKKSIDKDRKKDFEAFLTKKTGLEWTQRVSLTRLDIASLVHNYKNTKR